MKALVYKKTRSLVFEEVNKPIAGNDESLIKVEAVGICGSDMHAFLGHDERRPPPLILGHEAAGLIVKGKDEGKRVTINPLVTCEKCNYCLEGKNNICQKRQIISMPPREGAFAEFLSIPDRNLTFVPENFSIEKSSLTEPLACGWHAVRLGLEKMNKDINDINCLVIGGGAIGLGSALSLKAKNLSNIFLAEKNSLRHKILKKTVGINIFNPEDNLQIHLNSFDLVIDAVGFSATREMASKFVAPGGVIVHIGLGDNLGGLDIRRLTLQEITFIGTYTYTPNDFKETANAIFDGKLGPLDWFSTKPLDEGQKGFDDILNGNEPSPKIILKP